MRFLFSVLILFLVILNCTCHKSCIFFLYWFYSCYPESHLQVYILFCVLFLFLLSWVPPTSLYFILCIGFIHLSTLYLIGGQNLGTHGSVAKYICMRHKCHNLMSNRVNLTTQEGQDSTSSQDLGGPIRLGLKARLTYVSNL